MSMTWHSEEIKENYFIVNRLFVSAITSKYPDIEKIGIVKESFNDLFDPNRYEYKIPMIDIFICIDFIKNLGNSQHNQNIGVDGSKILTYIFTSMFPEFEPMKKYNRVLFIDKLNINTKQYCEGVVPYIVE